MEAVEPSRNGRVLSRDQILAAANRLESERVHVEELGGDVIVRALTAAERDEYEASIIIGRGKNVDVVMRGLRAKLVVRSVVDEDGNHVFTEADIEALGKVGSRPIDQIFSVAQRLSGLTQKDVEELAGNSASVPSAGSPSDLP